MPDAASGCPPAQRCRLATFRRPGLELKGKQSLENLSVMKTPSLPTPSGLCKEELFITVTERQPKCNCD